MSRRGLILFCNTYAASAKRQKCRLKNIFYWCLVLLFLHEFNSLREITFSSHFHVAHTSRYLIRENLLQRAL